MADMEVDGAQEPQDRRVNRQYTFNGVMYRILHPGNMPEVVVWMRSIGRQFYHDDELLKEEFKRAFPGRDFRRITERMPEKGRISEREYASHDRVEYVGAVADDNESDHSDPNDMHDAEDYESANESVSSDDESNSDDNEQRSWRPTDPDVVAYIRRRVRRALREYRKRIEEADGQCCGTPQR